MSIDRFKERRRKRLIRKCIAVAVMTGVLLFMLLLGVLFYYGIVWTPVKDRVTVAPGEKITQEMFLLDTTANVEFVTDLSKIDTNQLGTHMVVMKAGLREFSVLLDIKDTVPPTAEPVEVSTKTGVLPEVHEFVTDIKDHTTVKISFEKEPDVSKGGTFEVVIVLKDEAGNTSKVKATLHVISDTEAPVITGAENKEIFVGETVSYRAGVVVTDNEDENPTLTIDNSQVKLDEAGVYEVIYTATDAAGNTSSVTITLTVKKKPAGYVDEETVMELAQEVLDKILKDDMTPMEKAFAIYRYANKNIMYDNTSDKSDWKKAAYQGFTKKTGDCFVYYAVARALYDAAGIENVDIVKSDTSHSRHYWSLINLGDGWYHVDSTPRKGDGDLFFMVTDEEILAYSKAHSNSHIFDGSLYPDRATESVQDKVDYTKGKIKN